MSEFSEIDPSEANPDALIAFLTKVPAPSEASEITAV